MNNLFDASDQWCKRPADERFFNVQDALEKAKYYRSCAQESSVSLKSLNATSTNGELLINGNAGTAANISHYGFDALCRRIKAPSNYLRSLPVDLVAENINSGLSSAENPSANLLFHKNGGLTLRAMTSDKYTRIWNYEILEKLDVLTGYGWKTPPARPATRNDPRARPATDSDVLEARGMSLSINVGDMIAPAGVYVSDHDMFVFQVNEQYPITDGTDNALFRGFYITNSEVGAAALKLVTFLYRSVCGNHIIWGAKDVTSIKIVHRGQADMRFKHEILATVKKYQDASAYNTEQAIKTAQTTLIGQTKSEILDTLFGKNLMPRKDLEGCYKYAQQQSDETNSGDPRSLWGFSQGITRYAQDAQYADKRNTIEQASGKLLNMAF